MQFRKEVINKPPDSFLVRIRMAILTQVIKRLNEAIDKKNRWYCQNNYNKIHLDHGFYYTKTGAIVPINSLR